MTQTKRPIRYRLGLAILGIALSLVSNALATDIYVAPGGSDSNDGSQQSPLATIAAAQGALRKSKKLGQEPCVVTLADGVYYLPEALVFTPEDSGSATFPVVYRAQNQARAVLSGGLKLDLEWQPYKDGIFQAKTAPGLDIDQLFINSANQPMARYPNYDAAKKTDAYQGYAADAFSKDRAANWKDPAGGYILSLIHI